MQVIINLETYFSADVVRKSQHAWLESGLKVRAVRCHQPCNISALQGKRSRRLP